MSDDDTDIREDCVFMAKIADLAGRYDEMVFFMKKVVLLGVELTVEERNLFSVAFKNLISSRRASLWLISKIEQREESEGNFHQIEKITKYRKSIERELSDICNDILQLLDQNLIPSSQSDESKVFHYKLKGDYNRYLAETNTGDSRKKAANNSLESYNAATKLAQNLPSNHPVRLSLALNFSVFYSEILNSPITAGKLARKAFEEALCELDRLSEESYKDATIFLQLLRDVTWDFLPESECEIAEDN